MSRNLMAGSGWQRSTRLSKALASAEECSRRAEVFLQNVGGASNLLLLSGVGASLVTSFISGLMADQRLAARIELNSVGTELP